VLTRAGFERTGYVPELERDAYLEKASWRRSDGSRAS